ncbi:class I SAM-dependent methyltransferase [Cytobacillus purgationiresistens]|uniref:Ubiquinone/menaquinone biosynthesis C-methylase UbiE n=1 Tax=Cytobacillus purgationiresistens TaxID=863449 RepID=A0ABU0ALZ7_9BACI|nr:class I SAM-dependent methyltransferase [Cytobacillus purgationiresistens]MDQ0272291.1 ubiquinone/menaquinone biosynthesis C-methylase UbiE [Cytobacillus purgationiresistens]
MERNSLIKKFDKQANKYSKRRNNNHANKFRKQIFQDAEGKVLEVGIGSGLNFPFYKGDIELTGVDFSIEMLKTAEDAAKDYLFQTILIEGDVESVDFNENTFDTIVSSATLCAYQNPLSVLNKFQKWCKPEGKILMMEHGISTNKSLAWLQNTLNPLILKFIGCHQNRNIIEIVKKSNLKIIKNERHIAGYLYLIWAEP